MTGLTSKSADRGLCSSLCVVLTVLLPLLGPSVAPAQPDGPEQYPPPGAGQWEMANLLSVSECREPSGITHRPGADVFYVVDDGSSRRRGGIYEYNLKGELQRSSRIGGDLEGIVWNPRSERLYVVREGIDEIATVDPETLQEIRTRKVPREFKGKTVLTEGGDGLEGIAFVPDPAYPKGGYFLVANQNDPHGVLKLKLPVEPEADAVIEAHWPMPEVNIGEVYYERSSGEIWVSHAWWNLLSVLDPASGEVTRWEVLPGAAQEGVMLGPERRLWIAQDVGQVAIYERTGDRRAP